MMQGVSLIDDVVNRYLQRTPDAGVAMLTDPQYAYHLYLARQILAVIERAMENEGIPEPVRERVLRTVLEGTDGEPSRSAAI